MSLWDLAAIDLVVREAGGTFTNLEGRPGPVALPGQPKTIPVSVWFTCAIHVSP